MEKLVFIVALGSVMSCDPKMSREQKQSDVRLSGIGESCLATTHCEANLACVNTVCTQETSSRLGSYWWEVAQHQLDNSQSDDALVSLEKAIGTFRAEKIDPPATLYCETGEALRLSGKDDEKAAQYFHECLNRSAASSSSWTLALSGFAKLADKGLEPQHFVPRQIAQEYLTAKPETPPDFTSRKVTVTAEPKVSEASYGAYVAILQQELPALVKPCFEKLSEEKQNNAFEFSFLGKNRFVRGEYEEDDRWAVSTSKAQAEGSSVRTCVGNALKSKELRKYRSTKPRWESTLTVRFE